MSEREDDKIIFDLTELRELDTIEEKLTYIDSLLETMKDIEPTEKVLFKTSEGTEELFRQYITKVMYSLRSSLFKQFSTLSSIKATTHYTLNVPGYIAEHRFENIRSTIESEIDHPDAKIIAREMLTQLRMIDMSKLELDKESALTTASEYIESAETRIESLDEDVIFSPKVKTVMRGTSLGTLMKAYDEKADKFVMYAAYTKISELVEYQRLHGLDKHYKRHFDKMLKEEYIVGESFTTDPPTALSFARNRSDLEREPKIRPVIVQVDADVFVRQKTVDFDKLTPDVRIKLPQTGRRFAGSGQNELGGELFHIQLTQFMLKYLMNREFNLEMAEEGAYELFDDDDDADAFMDDLITVYNASVAMVEERGDEDYYNTLLGEGKDIDQIMTELYVWLTNQVYYTFGEGFEENPDTMAEEREGSPEDRDYNPFRYKKVSEATFGARQQQLHYGENEIVTKAPTVISPHEMILHIKRGIAESEQSWQERRESIEEEIIQKVPKLKGRIRFIDASYFTETQQSMIEDEDIDYTVYEGDETPIEVSVAAGRLAKNVVINLGILHSTERSKIVDLVYQRANRYIKEYILDVFEKTI